MLPNCHKCIDVVGSNVESPLLRVNKLIWHKLAQSRGEDERAGLNDYRGEIGLSDQQNLTIPDKDTPENKQVKRRDGSLVSAPCLRRFPEFDSVAFAVFDPAEFAEF
jgi:hypothetical protein